MQFHQTLAVLGLQIDGKRLLIFMKTQLKVVASDRNAHNGVGAINRKLFTHKKVKKYALKERATVD
jgi:hypothetical protein